MKLLTLNYEQRSYNQMRDRLIDLAKEYSFADIVRIENIELENYKAKNTVSAKTTGWAVTTILTKEERMKLISDFITSLDIGSQILTNRDFIIGSSEDAGDCCGFGGGGSSGSSGGGRTRERFDDVEEMAERYYELERQGKNPSHSNQHGPGGWVIEYDE